jgi:hypothetical protein
MGSIQPRRAACRFEAAQLGFAGRTDTAFVCDHRRIQKLRPQPVADAFVRWGPEVTLPVLAVREARSKIILCGILMASMSRVLREEAAGLWYPMR